MTPVAAANLAALPPTRAPLVARLRACSWTPPRAFPTVQLPRPPDADEVRVAGALGATVDELLARGARVTLWERDPARLIAWLSERDRVEALGSGRLDLASDLDLLEPGRFGRDRGPLVAHPVLGPLYARELAWLEGPPRAGRALLVDGGLLVEELGAALCAEGWGVWTWETTRASREEILELARRFQPDRVFVVNLVPGLAEVCAALGARLDVWEIDPSIEPPPPAPAVGRTTVWTWRRAQVEPLRALGWHAEWLPLGADPERRRPIPMTEEEARSFAAPVSFVGRSMALEAARYRRQVEAELRDALAAQGGDASDAPRIVAAVLAEQHALRASGDGTFILAERLDAACPGLRRRGTRHDPALMLGESAAAEWRSAAVRRLAPVGVHVWGDEGWARVAGGGVVWRGPAGHRHAVPRIYSNGGIHLDIGRVYQSDIVTLRVFEALACGAFVLASDAEELRDLFQPGVELDVWSTLDELEAKVAYWHARPEERARVAAEGRARALRDHTIHRRVLRMLG